MTPEEEAQPAQMASGPVELLMEHTKTVLEAENQLQTARIIRRVILSAIAIVPSVILAIYIATYLTWHKFDMKPVIWPVALLLIAFGIGVFSYISNSEDNTIPSVRDAALELEVARERRRLYAASLDLSPKIRRNIYQNEDVPRDILQFKQEGRLYGRINNVLQGIVIVGSIGASALSGLVQSVPQLRWVTVGATLSVGIAAGFSGYFKFKERSFYAQQTADDIEHELSAVILGITPYSSSDKREEDIKLFTEKVEKLKLEQRKRQQQLEQQSAAPRENAQ
jgi:hypothetical protein